MVQYHVWSSNLNTGAFISIVYPVDLLFTYTSNDTAVGNMTMMTVIMTTMMIIMIIVIATGDLYPENEKEEGKEEPEWIKTEREHFSDYRDRNKDGKMDRVRVWIVQPPLPIVQSLNSARHIDVQKIDKVLLKSP